MEDESEDGGQVTFVLLAERAHLVEGAQCWGGAERPLVAARAQGRGGCGAGGHGGLSEAVVFTKKTRGGGGRGGGRKEGALLVNSLCTTIWYKVSAILNIFNLS